MSAVKVSLILNDYDSSKEIAARLEVALKRANISIDDKNPDVVISVGGDGTMLRAFHKWSNHLETVRFVGVHTGHLGFYTDWRDYEILKLVETLKNDDGEAISYPLLELSIVLQDEIKEQRYLALNESTIRQVNRTMVANVEISGHEFECFRGDGLSVATPTGSTGYNRSVGGAVVNPQVNSLQLTELASLNSRSYRTLASPIILGEDDFIHLQINDDSEHIVTVDQKNLKLRNITDLYYRVAPERIKFLKAKHMNFWDRVKEAFIEDEN